MSRTSGTLRARATRSAVNASGRSLTMSRPAPDERAVCQTARTHSGLENARKPTMALTRFGSPDAAHPVVIGHMERPAHSDESIPSHLAAHLAMRRGAEHDVHPLATAQIDGGADQRVQDAWVVRIEHTIDDCPHPDVAHAWITHEPLQLHETISTEPFSFPASQESITAEPAAISRPQVPFVPAHPRRELPFHALRQLHVAGVEPLLLHDRGPDTMPA